MGLNIGWYKILEDGENKLFYTETMCSSSDGCESVLICYKNSKPCFIEYICANENTAYYKNCIITDYNDKVTTIEVDGETLNLKTQNIVKAALSINELF